MNIDKWSKKLPELLEQYNSALPFPHIVIDDFLPAFEADNLLQQFPSSADDEGWIHYKHFNENKHGLNEVDKLPANVLGFINFMHSPPAISFLEKLTGISNLIADETLEGAGIHLSERGGYLNMHADFSTHPQFNHLERKLNIILYLNKDWKSEYRGDLELWDAKMESCEKKIAPLFNRLVVFNTTNISYHGFPEPLLCPKGETRKSIALYYYNKTEANSRIKSTNYKTRPGDGLKALPNWVDNKLLWAYTYLKRKVGLNDKSASKLLNIKKWWSK
ncbi:MAG TPA: 2OG-Fe(II) oxygenase [Chitinophagales bacterium]|nr:2OG-Fe(II) oxygenase [Chitinophagales bacterium]